MLQVNLQKKVVISATEQVMFSWSEGTRGLIARSCEEEEYGGVGQEESKR
jgi:hypothetical protein